MLKKATDIARASYEPIPFQPNLGDFASGVVTVSPPGAADGQSSAHAHPIAGVGGLIAAEAHSGVIDWQRT